MRFVEDYWQDFIDFGFIKTETNGRIDYTLPKEDRKSTRLTPVTHQSRMPSSA